MIVKKFIVIPVLILLILFTSTFISLVSIYTLPEKIMGSGDTYVLLSSTDRNPLRSNLDIDLAYELENMSYITSVSPEIFVFTVIKENAVTVRGVDFPKFMKIENGSVIMGSMPKGPMDALVGENLYHYLGLHIGQRITIPGSFNPSVAVVNITGVFYTGTLADDEILISIPTAQKLAGIRYGQVSIIRFRANDVRLADKLMDPEYPKFTATLNVTGDVYYDSEFNLTVHIENVGVSGGLCNLSIQLWNGTIERQIYVNGNITFNLTLLAPEPGKWKVNMTVGNDVLTYDTSVNFTVLPRPVLFKGKSVVYTGERVNLTFLSKDGAPLNGTVVISGEDYHRSMEVNGTFQLNFPRSGRYSLSFHRLGYENKTVFVRAYDRMDLSNLTLKPKPIDGVIYLKEGENITVSGADTVYYSIDGGALRRSDGNISFPEGVKGDHRIELMAILGNSMGNQSFFLHIYKSENVSIQFSHTHSSGIYYNSSLNITIWSEIPLRNYTLWVNGVKEEGSMEQNFSMGVENYTYNVTLIARGLYMNVSIYATNVLGVGVNTTEKIRIIYPSDTEKPRIIVEQPLKIWGGNTTTVDVKDNTMVGNVSVFIFGRYFNSSGEGVTIPTVFFENGEYIFIPEGTYTGIVNATDVFGNVNVSEFQLTINNNGEKVPPVVVGPDVVDFQSSNDSFTFKAYDNSEVVFMGVYLGSNLLKSVTSPAGSNMTLQLNSSDVPDGLSLLKIVARDMYNNSGIFQFLSLKNYTDDTPPWLDSVTTKVWSGEDIVIKVSDNVKVDSITAEIFGRTYTSHSDTLKIPTMEVNGTKVNYTPEGDYLMNLTFTDIYGNENSTSILIEVNNTGEEIAPVIFYPEPGVYNATDTLSFISYDNVGISRVWIESPLGIVLENTSWNFSCPASSLGYGTLKLTVYAQDVNGNIASYPLVLVVRDNILPRVLTTSVRMWGGNSTNITLWDNLGVESATLDIFGRTFHSTGDRIEVDTEFIDGYNVSFIHPGTYYGVVRVKDMAGNVNTTYITIVIDNRGERNPPVITGDSYQVVSNKTDAVFYAFDNVGVSRMWWTLNGTVMGSSNSSSLIITFQEIPLGTNYIKVYAQDVNGNVAEMDAVIDVLGKPEVKVYAYLLSDSVESTERAVLTVVLENGANSGNYTLYIYLDGEEYYNITESMNSFETRTLTLNLPYLSKGEHTIVVGNQTLTLKVYEPPVEKVPIDLILKYNKDLKVTATETVIYKGFQISQGNFILVTFSLIAVGIILGALGMYSSMLKAINNKNIAILRAIGASNRTLMKFAVEDVVKYILPSIFGGLLLGYALVGVLEWLNVLRAFGHGLVVDITPQVILGSILISLGFLAFTAVLILKEMFHSKVVHLFGGERSEKIYTLEEVLNER